jgi:diaminopimelate epimerase
MQGAGNDFVLVDLRGKEPDLEKLAIAICNRHFGIGADGLLVLYPSAIADIRLRIFNADGSEASTCGNGIRCVAKYCYENGRYQKEGCVSIETLSGIRDTWIKQSAGSFSVRVQMGKPAVGARSKTGVIKTGNQLDITKANCRLNIGGNEYNLSLVSVGNWHAVYITDQPVREFPLVQLGPLVEKKFADGINFEVVRLLKDDKIEARVWEHGVGETLACGSGACAIGAVLMLQERKDKELTVSLPGGNLKIEWDKQNEIFLTGPVETVFSGDWPDQKQDKVFSRHTKPDINEVLA